MAIHISDWKARGYVPDSDDDEEDSQATNPAKVLLVQGWKDVLKDGAAVCERLQENGTDGTAALIPREQGQPAIRKIRAVEVRIPATNGFQSIGRRVAQNVGPNNFCSEIEEDIDELQQGHYDTRADAQLQAELPTSTRSGRQLSIEPVEQEEERTRAQRVEPSSRRATPSAVSSPLSELSSLPEPSYATTMFEPVEAVQSSNILHSANESHENEQMESAHPQTGTQARSTRNLRHRNPIQLHPYAIESEKYRQVLHARGLKALRFAQAESQGQLEDDSQNQEFGTSQVSRSSTPEIQGFIPSSPPPLGDDLQPAEDEFPDMDALLRRQPDHYIVHGYKRRKTSKPRFKRPPGPIRSRVPSAETTHLEFGGEDVYDVPPSPPLSRSQTPNGVQTPSVPSFRIPPRTSATALPTPMTSSDPRCMPQDDLIEQGSAADHAGKDPQSSDDSFSSTAASEDESVNQLQRVQRKIRGVLPASWLRLDLRTQVKKPDKDRRPITSASPEKRDLHRGVARPVSRNKSKSPSRSTSRQDFFTLSDEDSASHFENSPHRPMHRLAETIDIDADDDVDDIILDSRLGEAPEENDIDAMLPTTRRTPYHSRKGRKRQRVLSEYGLQPSANEGRRLKASQPQRKFHARRPQVSHAQILKPKFRPPRLSVLDTPWERGESRNLPAPLFLRIVSRTVRSRRDKGRHSPSRKYLKLALREDDYDANQTLRDWKGGSIAPIPFRSTATGLLRKPLLPRSGNSALPPAMPKTRLPAMSTTQIASKSCNPMFRSRSRKLQSSLDARIHRQSEVASARPQEIQQPGDIPQRKNAEIRRGQLISSLRNADELRPAMLETLQDKADRVHPKKAFSRGLFHMAQYERSAQEQGPFWDRLMDHTSSTATSREPFYDRAPSDHNRPQSTMREAQSSNPKKQRKRRPRHIDVSKSWSAEVDSSSPICWPSPTSLEHQRHKRSIDVDNVRLLTGLGPYDTQYTSTFDVMPFPQGTCFHQSTFIGSGGFARSLRLADCDLDHHRGFTILIHEQQTFRWGPWTEAVASELGMLCESVNQVARQQPSSTSLAYLVSVRRNVAQYFSDNLSFLDPVDRISFLQRCMNIVRAMVSDVPIDFDKDVEERQIDVKNSLVSTRTLCLIIANELRLVARHPIVSEMLKRGLHLLMSECSDRLIESIGTSLENLANTSSNYGPSISSSLMVRDDNTAEALIVAQRVLEYDAFAQARFWDSLLITNSPAHDNIAVVHLERSWQKLFMVLPYLEFDAQGVLETGRRFRIATDSWKSVRKLITPVLEAYISTPKGQSPSFNTYCRALFSRCLYLINAWGWRRCDTIIGILFDFFARNNLNHLRNEQSHGSPGFLEHLSNLATLTAEPGDRCFHLLLKIIGSGIRFMRQIFPEKKIRDLVWRLMPNHGRSHPKEEAIRQEDLDALRNHHDLLCTLYWASSPGVRPRLSVIRNLVQVERSHKEACHINIRAWSNLVRFQLSTDEPTTTLEAFADWYDELIRQVLQQHRLARTEAEEEVKSLQQAQGILISQQLLESTISRNQRQIESVLSDALTCLKRAIEGTRSKEAVDVLLSSNLTAVFDIFDSTRSQSITPIIEALDVVLLYTEKCSQWLKPALGTNANDDSQEYGDWSAFAEEDLDEDVPSAEYTFLEEIQDPLRHLLSNCLGADITPPEGLLSKVVHVWAVVSQKLVSVGKKSWSDYIGSHGNDAWSSFRETDQTQKYTSYYLAILIEHDTQIYKENVAFFLRSWMESLVERESLLKFQHRLTGALLNADPEHPLLSNPPFWKSKSGDKFDITPVLFSERRLSLISGILSNMRTSIDNPLHQPETNTERLKREYKDLLKHLMAMMKLNYQNLGSATYMKGAYVDFVHRIIESLQQHTSEFCHIDRFFTDNVSFPLPIADPSYVVGQLKNYGLRLEEARAPKELAVFLQSVSERAAIDGQQINLVGQLCAAMVNSVKVCFPQPSLREIIIKTIMPAYTDMAFQTACGWILALPYLEAARNVFDELLQSLDGFHAGSTEGTASMIVSTLSSIRGAVTPVLHHPILIQSAKTIKLFRACYSCITALLPTLDYLVRLDSDVKIAVQHISFFKTIAEQIFQGQQALEDHEFFNLQQFRFSSVDEGNPDLRKFIATELRQTLDRNWVCTDERYFVARGSSRREVVVDIGLLKEEREMLRTSIDEFGLCLRSMPALGDDEGRTLQDSKAFRGLEDLII